jgi:hypothetical protein
VSKAGVGDRVEHLCGKGRAGALLGQVRRVKTVLGTAARYPRGDGVALLEGRGVPGLRGSPVAVDDHRGTPDPPSSTSPPNPTPPPSSATDHLTPAGDTLAVCSYRTSRIHLTKPTR